LITISGHGRVRKEEPRRGLGFCEGGNLGGVRAFGTAESRPLTPPISGGSHDKKKNPAKAKKNVKTPAEKKAAAAEKQATHDRHKAGMKAAAAKHKSKK
jgi:hypothetical protein